MSKTTKSFSFSKEIADHLDQQDRKSAYVEGLVKADLKGRILSSDTAKVLTQYQDLFGEKPDAFMRNFLQKRIAKLQQNVATLQNNPDVLSKIRVGSAFYKLNLAFDKLVRDNLVCDPKMAITFNTLFKESKCNHQAIRRWIHANQGRLDDYHASIGISNPAQHNRQGGVINRVRRLKQEGLNREVKVSS